MGARIVLRLNKYTMNRKSLQEFLDKAEELGLRQNDEIVYALDHEGRPCLVAELPERAVEGLERKARLREPTKAQQAVREQLQSRRAAVKTGSAVPGHVPPVAKNGRVLKTRKKKRD